MEASRQILWNIGSTRFLDVCTILTAVFLATGFFKRIRAWHKGRKAKIGGHAGPGLRALLRAVSSQKGMIRGGVYLAMHRCLFYGILLLFAGTALLAIEMHLGVDFISGALYLVFGLLVDLAGIAVLTGLTLAAYKRYIVKPDRLESGVGDALPLLLIAVVVVSGFLLKGMRIVATTDPWAAWSPVGYASARMLGVPFDQGRALGLHRFFWYGHAALAFTLIALIPWTKLLHMLAVPLSIFSALPLGARRATASIPGVAPRGARTVDDCTRKQLIEADACIECGRCKKLCPVFQGGTPFAPVTLLKKLRRLVRGGHRDRSLVGAVIEEAALWSCTLCRSCEERCPMDGQHGDGIVAIRRGEVEAGRIPQQIASRFEENLAVLAGISETLKTPPAGFDVYLWPGCAEDRVDQTSSLRALQSLLEQAGVSWAVLEPPACCGGPVRRLGNEALFRRNAALNIGYLNKLKKATVVTCCPHCFDTLSSEYPPFASGITLMHHVQFLAGLAAEGRLSAGRSVVARAVYHDPCFLGRYHETYDAPRALLGSIDGLELIEAKHSRQKSFCCGAGGGTVVPEIAVATGREWLERMRKEGAETIITACPYCRENLQAAAKEEGRGTTLVVWDVVEALNPAGPA